MLILLASFIDFSYAIQEHIFLLKVIVIYLMYCYCFMHMGHKTQCHQGNDSQLLSLHWFLAAKIAILFLL